MSSRRFIFEYKTLWRKVVFSTETVLRLLIDYDNFKIEWNNA